MGAAHALVLAFQPPPSPHADIVRLLHCTLVQRATCVAVAVAVAVGAMCVLLLLLFGSCGVTPLHSVVLPDSNRDTNTNHPGLASCTLAFAVDARRGLVALRLLYSYVA